MAAKVTGFDVVMPENGNEEEGGEEEDSELHWDGESIARVKKREG